VYHPAFRKLHADYLILETDEIILKPKAKDNSVYVVLRTGRFYQRVSTSNQYHLNCLIQCFFYIPLVTEWHILKIIESVLPLFAQQQKITVARFQCRAVGFAKIGNGFVAGMYTLTHQMTSRLR
jgi:hypothetical protein